MQQEVHLTPDPNSSQYAGTGLTNSFVKFKMCTHLGTEVSPYITPTQPNTVAEDCSLIYLMSYVTIRNNIVRPSKLTFLTCENCLLIQV